MGTQTNNAYNDNSIKVLKGLEPVRKRPGMYIGNTESGGLHHLVWEIVDNAIDEALAGYCTRIDVTIESDNSITVQDNGRGIPIGINKDVKKPTPQVIFNELHAGGKFDEENGYKVSGGLHGVGSAVVNALSKYLTVTINRENKIYTQTFLDGGNKIEKPTIVDGPKKTGTKVHFLPNGNLFQTTIFDYKIISQRLRQSAFLIKGLTITLEDKREGIEQYVEFHSENGIQEFVTNLSKDKQPLNEPTYFAGEYEVLLGKTKKYISTEISLQYCQKAYNENIISFVNNVHTKDGGTHEVGFRSGITRAFNEHARLIGVLKDKDPNLEGSDVREGLIAVISVRVPEELLQFEGQTKGRLGTSDAKPAVETLIYEKMKQYLAENGKITDQIISKAMNAAKAREASRKARDEVRLGKQKAAKPANLLGKLTPAQYRNPKKNELFLVEGDSAGGSAKQGRDRTYQAILPLRGKVLNTAKVRIDEVMKNEELVSIINSVGAGFGPDFDINKSNYDKIIIMTDADTDGCHIQILLLTFFFRYMRPMIEQGRIFIATPPLYKITFKNSVEYAWTDEELRDKLLMGRSLNVQRYKGLGEMNPEQLWETTMQPGNRTLIRVNIQEESEVEKRIMVLMGDDVEPRREWIESNIEFDVVDNFNLEELGEDE